ncbi:hypothetical protein NFI96_014385, partial [Prochilodus magdalenae]
TSTGPLFGQCLSSCYKEVDLMKCPHDGNIIQFTRANLSYSRQALLDINIRYTNIGFDHPLDFNQLLLEVIRTPGPSESLVPTVRARRRERKQRRGKCRDLRAKLMLSPHRTALPSVFLANVRSLPGKLDELKLWTLTQRRLMDCNLMFFTETWLNSDVVELEGRALFRADRSAAAMGKTHGGGNCIYVNKAWFNVNNTVLALTAFS